MKYLLALFSSVLFTSAAFGLTGFTDDFDSALARAKASGKPVLALFTGSDWCLWCKKLEAEILTAPGFVASAEKDFELVYLDFPSEKVAQSAALKSRNQALMTRYQVNGFPTIVIIDGEGREVTRTGYAEQSVPAYLAALKARIARAGDAKSVFAAVDQREAEIKAALPKELSALGKRFSFNAPEKQEATAALLDRLAEDYRRVAREIEAMTIAPELTDFKEERLERLGLLADNFITQAEKIRRKLAIARQGGLIVPLTVRPGNNMHLADAVVDGIPCRVLVDTGATHTTFDTAFVTNRLPWALLDDVRITGKTNVSAVPKIMYCQSLRLGEHALDNQNFVLVVPLGDLSSSVGEPVEGIIGLSSLREQPFVLMDDKLIMAPSEELLKGFGPSIENRGDLFRPIVRANGLDFLIDSASTYSFVTRGLWPETTNTVKLAVAEVNGNSEMAPIIGETRRLEELNLEITPRLHEKTLNCLGADLLKSYDIYIDPPGKIIRFRKRSSTL